MNKQPCLYMMCGLAFSGKTTLAKAIAKATGSVIVSFDDIYIKEVPNFAGVDKVETWRITRRIGEDEIARLLSSGKSVVYDNTNARKEHRDFIRGIADKSKAKTMTIFVNTPIDLIRERQRKNKFSKERVDVNAEDFNEVLQQLEPPVGEENMFEFIPETNLEEFLDTIRP
jgi:predicted kinase